MSSADKNDNGMFDFFPDLLPDDDEQFDSEEEALDAILRKNTAEPEEEQLWQTPAAETEAPYIPADTSFPAEQPVQNDDMISEEPVIAVIREEEAEAISPVVEAVPALVEEEAQDVSKPVSERMLRRMALGYLASKHPDMIGAKVRTFVPRITVDAAAVCLNTSPGLSAAVRSTMLVVAAAQPEKYLMPRSMRARCQAELDEQLEKKAALENMIRSTEPELQTSLFPDEERDWDYDRSKSVKYHRCLRKIEKLRYDLQFTGKLDRLIAEQVANENYLLIPDDQEIPDSIPEQWGILLAHKDYTVTVARPAMICQSPAQKQQVFALYTGAAGVTDIQFANGVLTDEDGTVKYSPIPRRRPHFNVL